MINNIKNKLWARWQRWHRRRSPNGNPQVLNSNNLYILPTGFGWTYFLVVASLFIGAINYQISTVFLMTFLLVIVGLGSAWEAHANLNGLRFKLISIEDATVGQPGKISLLIEPNPKLRWGLELHLAKQTPFRISKIPPEGLLFILPIETTKRGRFSLPPINISTLFPFGIFRVWGYAYFDQKYFVYPDPVSPDFWPQTQAKDNHLNQPIPGEDELYDLKQVESPWSQPNRIAWKIAAKNQGWFVKTMESNEGEFWLFRLQDLPSKDIESNLQHLSYWVHEAELKGYLYGLELNKHSTSLNQGPEHLQNCLRHLAEHQ